MKRPLSGWVGVAAFTGVIVVWDLVAITTGRLETISAALRRLDHGSPEGQLAIGNLCDLLKVHLTHP